MSQVTKIEFYRKQFEKLTTEDLVAKRALHGNGPETSAAIDQILASRKNADDEKRHRELIEASMAGTQTGDTHINVGGNFNAHGSNFGSVISEERKSYRKQGDDWRHKIIPPIIAGIVLLIVTAVFRYYFPQWFPK